MAAPPTIRDIIRTVIAHHHKTKECGCFGPEEEARVFHEADQAEWGVPEHGVIAMITQIMQDSENRTKALGSAT